jgi:hypothetical protein
VIETQNLGIVDSEVLCFFRGSVNIDSADWVAANIGNAFKIKAEKPEE